MDFAEHARALLDRARRAAEESGPSARAARRLGGNLAVLRSVGSTNALARRVVEEYHDEQESPPPAALVAFEQTAGRGRHGAAWASPAADGAWVTLLQPLGGPQELPLLPLCVPVALADVLDRHLPAASPCRIKWPNDLLVDGRKIGGVLLDAITGADEATGAAAIGFGINYSQDEAALDGLAGERGATSLALAADGDLPPLAELTWELIEAVLGELGREADPARAVERYRERSVHRRGDRLSCKLPDGRLEGAFLGFDERGFLRLELTAGAAGRRPGDEVLVTAGEVAG